MQSVEIEKVGACFEFYGADMVNTELDFHKRLAVLGRKHAAMCKGYVMRMRADGLMDVHIVRPNALRHVPLRGLMLLVIGFCGFKAVMLSTVGETSYDARLAKLEQGTVIEQGGAWLLQVDPATALVASVLNPGGR